jgi:hypothetical protein
MSWLSASKDRKKRTISTLDPYTPRGLTMNWSKALKSTLVTEAYDPGHIALIKRLRESCAMMTLSTTKTQFQFVGTSKTPQKVLYRSHCSRIH